MAKKKAPETTAELLELMTRFLGGASDLSTDEIKDDLRSMDIDPDAVVQRVKGLVESSVTAHRLAWKDKAREAREIALRQLDGVEVSPPPTDLKKQVADLLASLGEQGDAPRVQAYWRKFEKATDHDLRVLLEDLRRLEELRKLTEGLNDGS